MKKLYIPLCGATAALLMAACQGGKTAAAAEAGDTLEMKYAKLLTIVKHGDGEESSVYIPFLSLRVMRGTRVGKM